MTTTTATGAQPRAFKPIAPQEFAALDPEAKQGMAEALHQGLIGAAQGLICESLHAAIERGARPDELAVVVAHKSDGVVLDGIPGIWDEGREVAVIVVRRAEFAAGLRAIEHAQADNYHRIGNAVAAPAPGGACWLTVFGYDLVTAVPMDLDLAAVAQVAAQRRAELAAQGGGAPPAPGGVMP